ncbi:ThiF family adenylyltransferase [Cellulomonas aerilata]|uniref:Putative adenylyltransferase/sulfurtransferase MoeZ n=1 Tax=Cellulomonas aerilata TaxID=515326 RepID=A0A512D856_9CELL|nr:ThiF family adenylyltransferase [Cellulomonas aerilata]GEO32565.1 putative adenylyltransferase/sulfurtransferase MoeZ [Cellulomonas aerilata]
MSPARGGVRVPPLVEPGPPLDAAAVTRWSRHLLLPGVGEVGQRRLTNARVCVVGAGGLGAPVLQYLAAAGVGTLGIVDPDEVELSNLQRQVLHGTADVGRPKVDSARDAVHAIDGGVRVVAHPVRLTATNAEEILAGYDLVVDGTDNFPTRYAVNDACVRLGLPEVWGSVLRFDAQVSVFWGRPPDGVPAVQLRDLFPEAPPPGSVPSCAEGGVLGALCGQVGSVMATEAVKLLTGAGEPLLGRVLVLDALAGRWSEVPLSGAPADGPAPPASRGGSHGSVPGPGPHTPDGAPPPAEDVPTVTARRLAERLAARDRGGDRFVLVDVREPGERALVAIPGAVSIPLGDVLAGTADLPRDVPVVLHCHSGVRSAQAGRALLDAGYSDVRHVGGGVLAWVADVDPTLPTY